MGEFDVITILGSGGGVSRALLSLLNKTASDKKDPIYSYISKCKIYLADIEQRTPSYYIEQFENLRDKITLCEFDANNREVLLGHFMRSNTRLVVDVSRADTLEVLRCCNELGIPYINTAFEDSIPNCEKWKERFGLLVSYRLFEEAKNSFKETTGIINSGMNPGVVQWMAVEMLRKNPDEHPLGCYIVEHDTSFYTEGFKAEKDTIYTTWSPDCYIEEAVLNYPVFMNRHTPLLLYSEVYEQEFKVNLGEKIFYGYLVPHEEVLTLGRIFDLECGFIYRINEHTVQLIKQNLKDVENLKRLPKAVLNPDIAPMVGEDLVGVLLVYPHKEIYMYNVSNNEDIIKRFNVSATYFQVACGIYGAICSVLLDNLPPGVFYVDELLLKTDTNYGRYLNYYMKEFIEGENDFSEGCLMDRMKISE